MYFVQTKIKFNPEHLFFKWVKILVLTSDNFRKSCRNICYKACYRYIC